MNSIFSRSSVRRVLALAALMVVIVLPVTAETGALKWQDRGSLLPYRDGVSISLSAERGGQWMLSDGTHLYRFDGTTLLDVTSELRARGIGVVTALASNGRTWMVISAPSDRAATMLVTNGETWNDVTGKFGQISGAVDAVGAEGQWYVRTFSRATTSQPSLWEAYQWNGSAENAVRLTLPEETSRAAFGCFADGALTQLCTGQNGFYRINGFWYFLGGKSEARGMDGRITQRGMSTLWRVTGGVFEKMSVLDGLSAVSGMWVSPKAALLSVSRSGSNPYATDQWFLYNGSTLNNVTDQASATGLRGQDTRLVRAAWNGRAWLILSHKHLVRFDGRTMTHEGEMRDLFQTMSSNGAGATVFAGARSVAGSSVASEPLTAHVAFVQETSRAATVIPRTPEPRKSDVVPAVEYAPLPPNLVWIRDGASQIGWTEYFQPTDKLFSAGQPVTYAVAVNAGSGIDRAEIWVNGSVVRQCAWQGSKATNICAYTLEAQDYKPGAPVFVNARAVDARGKGTWTTGLWTKTETPAAQVVTPKPEQAYPVFYSRATLSPTGLVRRGTTLIYRTVSQNNTSSLDRVEIYVNGKVYRACSFGAAVSPVACDTEISTDMYAPGTTVSFVSKAIAAGGMETWGGAMSATIAGAAAQPMASQEAPNGASSWVWMAPDVSLLTEGQMATFAVGAWSPADVTQIEIVIDGSVRASCLAESLGGNQECSVLLSTSDYTQGHVATVNARITDAAGAVYWSEARYVRIKRSWEPLPEPDTYVTITTDHEQSYAMGERVTITARGWSPVGIARIEVYASNVKVATCHADQCAFTTPSLSSPTLEYRARVVDNATQEVWTPVQGLRRK